MNTHDLNVLLVEDDQNVSMTLRSMLIEFGISNVYDAVNGEEALALLQEAKEDISLVVCDWNMPKVTGIEVLEAIRKTSPEMPFLMVTARADKSSVLAAKEHNVSVYICKPFSYGEFKKKMNYIVNHWF
jgi:two-component system chemotaxis response regulator CheY